MAQPQTTPSEHAVQRLAMPGLIDQVHPGHFAAVMATGIVSIACWHVGLSFAAQSLLWVNLLLFALLTGLNLARLLTSPRMVLAELQRYETAFGFFAPVAAVCVLGGQFVTMTSRPGVALGLWSLGVLLWLVLTYAIFTVIVIGDAKPDIATGLHGGWLLAVVATQAVSVLGSSLATEFASGRELALFFAMILWLAGGMLYLWIISLIFYRYAFWSMDPAAMTPPYWINMGAMAITTLAGTALLSAVADSPPLSALLPFIEGVTLLAWATATWWIPLLLILGVWRHVQRRVRLAYESKYWSLVFPLGMYATCTFRLAEVLNLGFLRPLATAFVYLGLLAWVLTCAGMSFAVARTLRRDGDGQGARPIS